MANEAGGEGDRILRVLMRFGLDEQSAVQVSKVLDEQERGVADLIKQWDMLRNQSKMTEEETVTMMKASITGQKMQEDQLLAIGKAYEAKQAAESAAAQKVQADLETEADRLKAIQENTDQIAQSFTNILALGRGEISLGRGLTSFGRLINNDDITRLGQAVTGVGRLTSAIGRLPQAIKAVQALGGIGSLLGGGALLVGGALVLQAGAGAAEKAVGLSPSEDKAAAFQKLNEAIKALPAEEQARAMAALKDRLQGVTDGSVQQTDIMNKFADELGKDSAATQKMLDSVGNAAYMSELAAQAQTNAAAKAKLENMQFAQSIDHTAISAQTGAQALEVMGNILKGIGLPGAGSAVGGALLQFNKSYRDQVTAFDDFQKNITKSEEKYGDDRQKIVDANLKQINDLTLKFEQSNTTAWNSYLKAQQKADQNYADQRIKILTSGADAEIKAEQSYYASRAKAAESYNIEVQRMEEAHQVEMQRLSEDHTKNLRKLADSRDALGIEDEMEKYRTDRQRAEEDYQRQAAQKSQDFARQVADMEQQFQEQEKVRKDDRQKQLAELAQQKAQDDASRKQDYTDAANQRAAQFQQQLDADKQNGKDKLDQLDQQHQDELSQLNDAWTTRRQQLGLWLAGEQTQFDNYMQARQDDLQKWINTHLSLPGAPGTAPTVTDKIPVGAAGHQAGGYQDYTGLAYMHAGEFVANANTTRALERLVGGQLNQQNVLGATGGAGQISISVNQTFSGQESSPEKYREIVHEVITDVFNKAMRQ